MPLSIPSDRPSLSDLWAYNERADAATLARLLASWEHFTFAYDVPRTPSDGTVFNLTTGAFVRGTDNVVTTAAGNTRKFLGEFFVPPPLSFARRLEVWVRASVSSAGSAGASLYLISRSTGRVEKITITNGSMGGIIGWIQAFVQATPLDIIEIWIEHNSTSDGTTVFLLGLDAWWEPLDGLRSDVTIETSAPALSQTYFGTNLPDSTYQLRWLIRRANQFTGHRPRPVYTQWWDRIRATSTPGLGIQLAASRFKVFLGDGVTQVTLRAFLKRQQAGIGISRVDFLWDGSTIASGTTSGWNQTTVSSGLAKGVHEAEFRAIADDNGSGSTAEAWIHSVCAWESTVSGIPLAAGDSLPSAFATLQDERFSAGRPIRHDDRTSLIKNMYWLWKNRYQRVLLSCGLYSEGPTGSGYSIGTPNAADVMADYWIPDLFGATPRIYLRGSRTTIAARGAPTAFDIVMFVQFLPSQQVPISGVTKRVGGMGRLDTSALHWHRGQRMLTGSSASLLLKTVSLSDAQTKNHGRAAGVVIEDLAPATLP